MKTRHDRLCKRPSSDTQTVPTSLSDHSESSDLDSDHECRVCKKTFSSKQCLKEHLYKHTNQKPYKCKSCGLKFRHASQFTLHKQSHGTSPNYFWPKLEEMEKNTQFTYKFYLENTVFIELPPISEAQTVKLPLADSLGQLN